MQVDVGQDRTDDPSLRRSFSRRLVSPLVHHTGFQKSRNQPLEVRISDPLVQAAHHPLVVYMIKKSFNICFNHIVYFSLHDHVVDFFYACVCISSRSVSVGQGKECRFIDCLQYLRYSLLHHFVYHRGYPQRPHCPVVFADRHPSYRTGCISFYLEQPYQFSYCFLHLFIRVALPCSSVNSCRFPSLQFLVTVIQILAVE